jgi:hypothetical protein
MRILKRRKMLAITASSAMLGEKKEAGPAPLVRASLYKISIPGSGCHANVYLILKEENFGHYDLHSITGM